CGDGTCAPGETANTCPQDCKTTTNNCGNLKCDDGETKTSCPYDCSPFAAQISACAQSKCSADAAACSAQPTCVAAVGAAIVCVEACKGESNCIVGCASKAGNDATAMKFLLCINTNGCVPTGPTCGNGKCEDGETSSTCAADCKPAGPTCGDGKCIKGETYSSCKQDCGGSGGTFSQNTCWDSKCTKESAACKADYICSGYIGCIKADKDGDACAKQHGWTDKTDIDNGGDLLDALQKCGWKACADPNGAKCSSPGKDGAKNRCGQYDSTWPCNCDSGCTKFGDCCSDYKATCPSE
ncbi:MAG: hypothetical protein KC502_08610, partial [Myxococcales bacterium]|nr:hypothetical protein [Myxococcales bacterium]